MNKKIVLLGGGLANGLIALNLLKKGFKDFLLVEKNKKFGGNHTWSFHSTDVSKENFELLKPMIERSWDGQSVEFTSYSRDLNIGYNSISSESFHLHLFETLPAECVLVNSECELEGNKILLENQTIEADIIFDGRGLSPKLMKKSGFQKFIGMELEFKNPHGLVNPIIMDATVEQIDGYRFMYSLPFSEKRMLVEDTYYSRGSAINDSRIESEVIKYAEKRFGTIKQVIRKEREALPIPVEAVSHTDQFPIVNVGLRGAQFHPVTGYSVAYATRFAEFVAQIANTNATELYDMCQTYKREVTKNNSFFYFLNKMLFGAAEDEKRVKVFEGFYKLPENLIQRFYRGDFRVKDKMRFFVNKPPVTIKSALKSVTTREWMSELG